jgi:hypothetical protein
LHGFLALFFVIEGELLEEILFIGFVVLEEGEIVVGVSLDNGILFHKVDLTLP